MAKDFGAGGFLGRWLFALLLVLGTYNPSGYSYISWAFGPEMSFGPILAVVGIALLIGWIMFLRATFMSLGLVGILLGSALFAAIIWLAMDLGLLSMESPGMLTWVVLVVISLILAGGMSWSHIRRRLSGQFDVDEKDH